MTNQNLKESLRTELTKIKTPNFYPLQDLDSKQDVNK